MIPPLLLEKAKAKAKSLGFEGDKADKPYLEWLKRCPSCLTNDFDAYGDGEGVADAAHNRKVEDGAGVGIKPPFSAFPLTRQQHSMTHSKGQSYYDKQWVWDKRAVEYLEMWVNDIPPPQEAEAGNKCELDMRSANHIMATVKRAERFFSLFPDKILTMTLQPKKNKRTTKQNAYYFGVVVPLIQKAFIEKNNSFVSVKFVHGYLKLDYYTEDLKRCVIAPNGKEIIDTISSTKLNTIQFEKWMTEIRQWADTAGIYIPLPNECNDKFNYKKD